MLLCSEEGPEPKQFGGGGGKRSRERLPRPCQALPSAWTPRQHGLNHAGRAEPLSSACPYPPQSRLWHLEPFTVPAPAHCPCHTMPHQCPRHCSRCSPPAQPGLPVRGGVSRVTLALRRKPRLPGDLAKRPKYQITLLVTMA